MDLKLEIQNTGADFYSYSYVLPYIKGYLREFPFAVTFGIRLSDAIIDEIDDRPTYTYFHHYRTVNSALDAAGLKIMTILISKGYKAYQIAASQTSPDAEIPYSGVFQHKTGACLSKEGFIGKNDLFIHKKFGPKVRLGTVLTDHDFGRESIRTDDTIEKMKAICSKCSNCVSSCPAMAIKGNIWYEGINRDDMVDAQACSLYMNKSFKHIGRGSVCGICIKVCPLKGDPDL